jgi:Reverse transcriptase (RNA-dependent DNA polymerase)
MDHQQPNLEEELYLKEPEGYQEFLGERQSINHYLNLNKSIYGLVQAARAWWKRFASMFCKDLNFEQCKSEICLLKRKLNEGIVLLTMYVDDCFVIGDKLAVKKTMEEIGKLKGATMLKILLGVRSEEMAVPFTYPNQS